MVEWGLFEWGHEMRGRTRRLSKAELIENLPPIPTGQGGKGLFKYKRVLPQYLISMLELSDAPLNSSEIRFIVRAKVQGLPKSSGFIALERESEGKLLHISDGRSLANESGMPRVFNKGDADQEAKESASIGERLSGSGLIGRIKRKR